MKGGDVLALGVLRALATRAERLRRGRAAARVRRGVARRALRPRPALRGLRRLPVLRGRPAGRRRRGRGRPAQGGRHAERDRARAQRALGLGARQGHQRAAGAGLGGPGGRGQPGPARARSASPRCRRCSTPATPSTSCPASAELVCDLRADSLDAFDGVLQALPAELGGARLEARLVRQWPGMDAREATAPLLRPRPTRSGGRSSGRGRGGASDAAHFAATIPFTVDGLGPARRRRARAPRVRAGPVAAAPRGDRAGRRRRRAARLIGGRSRAALSANSSRKPPHPPIYPLDCPGRLDQPNLCRTTAESGGTSSHLGGMGRIVAMSAT